MHLRRRIPEMWKLLRGTLHLMLEMEELWLATRKSCEAEVRVLGELAVMRAGLRRRLRISEFQAAYVRVRVQIPSIEIPSRLSLSCEQISPWRVGRLCQTRRDLARFWIAARQHFLHRQIGTVLRVDRIVLNAFRGIRLAAGFLTAMITGGSQP